MNGDARDDADGAPLRGDVRHGGASPQARPELEFPVELAVKAMGLNEPDFEPLVRALVLPHVPSAAPDAVDMRASRGGKYVSVSVRFTASSRSQLESIYRALHAEPRVLFTL